MEKTANPLKIGPGPTPDPQDDEVVIKVAYAAVNPTDWGVRIERSKSLQRLTAYSLDARYAIPRRALPFYLRL